MGLAACERLIMLCVCADDITEANRLITNVEPMTPQEYILKGVVNALLGQDQGIVCYRLSCLLLYITYYHHHRLLRKKQHIKYTHIKTNIKNILQ